MISSIAPAPSLSPLAPSPRSVSVSARLLSQHDRERSLPRARRSPQDQRVQDLRRDHLAEELSGSQQMLLADDFVEPPRTNPICQRLAERSARWKQTLRGIAFAPWHP